MSEKRDKENSQEGGKRYTVVESIGELLSKPYSRLIIETRYGVVILTHKRDARGKMRIIASILAYQKKGIFVRSNWIGHIFRLESVEPYVLEDLLRAVIEARKSML